MTSATSVLGLLGSRVRLEPMQREHFSALLDVATADRTAFALTPVPSNAGELEQYITVALRERDDGQGLPFVVMDATNHRVLGSTRFNHIQRWGGRDAEAWDAVEIGWTWLAPSAQRSGVNREMKWLMLQHAFDLRRARRVQLKTDARNIRSRDAIVGIGATFEGILRNFAPASDGPVRDVAMFAIIDRDWPEVAARLKARLRSSAQP
jgi:RimJ/RimL family protein N-acetyltransferase